MIHLDDIIAHIAKLQALGLLKPATPGPGTQLKNILAGFGIKDGNCGCQSMLAKMNGWGTAGCRAHMAEIVEHLEREGAERGWPKTISRFGAKALVRWAIRRAVAAAG